MAPDEREKLVERRATLRRRHPWLWVCAIAMMLFLVWGVSEWAKPRSRYLWAAPVEISCVPAFGGLALFTGQEIRQITRILQQDDGTEA
jgi:hypothetical protein